MDNGSRAVNGSEGRSSSVVPTNSTVGSGTGSAFAGIAGVSGIEFLRYSRNKHRR